MPDNGQLKAECLILRSADKRLKSFKNKTKIKYKIEKEMRQKNGICRIS